MGTQHIKKSRVLIAAATQGLDLSHEAVGSGVEPAKIGESHGLKMGSLGGHQGASATILHAEKNENLLFQLLRWVKQFGILGTKMDKNGTKLVGIDPSPLCDSKWSFIPNLLMLQD